MLRYFYQTKWIKRFGNVEIKKAFLPRWRLQNDFVLRLQRRRLLLLLVGRRQSDKSNVQTLAERHLRAGENSLAPHIFRDA